MVCIGSDGNNRQFRLRRCKSEPCGHGGRLMRTLALLVWTVTSLAAADDYELRMNRPAKVGEKETTSGKVVESFRMSISSEGKVVKSEARDIDFEYVAESEVLGVDERARPTDRRIKLVKLAGTYNGKPATQFMAGDEIVISLNQRRKTITVNQKPATEEQTRMLGGVLALNNRRQITDEFLGTAKRVKPGEEWKADQKKANAVLGLPEGRTDLPVSLEGGTKIIEASNAGGMPCLHIQTKYEMQGAGIPLPKVPPGIKFSKVAMTVSFDGHLPVDVKEPILPAGTIVTTMDIAGAGNVDVKGKPVPMEVSAQTRMTRTESSKRVR